MTWKRKRPSERGQQRNRNVFKVGGEEKHCHVKYVSVPSINYQM
jgi:hypothetical protein